MESAFFVKFFIMPKSSILPRTYLFVFYVINDLFSEKMFNSCPGDEYGRFSLNNSRMAFVLS